MKIVLPLGTLSYIRQFFLYESNYRILGDRTGSIGPSDLFNEILSYGSVPTGRGSNKDGFC